MKFPIYYFAGASAFIVGGTYLLIRRVPPLVYHTIEFKRFVFATISSNLKGDK